MTFWTLIRRSLRFHARTHLGVVLGAAIGSAALIGALVVGDSVRESLTDMAVRRLGYIHYALSTRARLFQTSLWMRLLSARFPLLPSHPSAALVLPGVVARQDGTARANRVNVVGVEEASWPLQAHWHKQRQVWLSSDPDEDVPDRGHSTQWTGGQIAFLNRTLARQLHTRPGDEIILRVHKPSALGLDAAISPRDQDSVALRLKVGAILTADTLGDFALTAQPTPPANLFLPLGFLSDKAGAPNHANLIVTAPVFTNLVGVKVRVAVPDETALRWLNENLSYSWLLEDAGLSVRAIEQPQNAIGPCVELTSARLFLEPAVIAAALTPRTILLTNTLNLDALAQLADLNPGTVLLTNRQAYQGDGPEDVAFARFVTNGVRVLTYLANLMRAGDRATPYSMVTAADAPFTPTDMRDDEILVNQWLADDLQVKPGDSVALSYYVVDSGSRLVERTNSFRIRQIVPLAGIYADRTLMPEFPGLAKAETTHDWDAGFPLVYPIREKDEAYWKDYRGTPKAFVTLAAGQAMWANRFGTLTAIRYRVPTNTLASACHEAVYRNLLANLRPEDVGLRFDAVREEAMKAATQGQDFGQLFLGFSIFLVVAALLLMALLFQLGLEQRASEVGILLALGLTPKQVRRLLLREGVALALVGGIIGALSGLGYAKAMVWALMTVWKKAIGGAELQFHVTAASLLIGLCASTLVAALTIWLTLRKQARQPARALLAGEVQSPRGKAQSRAALVAAVCAFAGGALVCWALVSGRTSDPGTFFGAGTLLLVAGLAATSAWLGRLARPVVAASRQSAADFRDAERPRSAEPPLRLTLGGLGVRGCTRRRKRSVATVALLACGCFVIVAIGVFRLDANRDAARHDSGTGGFALIGESTMPVVQDLNTKAGREFYGLDEQQLTGVKVVPLRVREGDVANCLNLNRAQKPRLLGVRPKLLAGRFTFASAAKGLDRRQRWELLQTDKSPITNHQSQIPEVPAIGDANSIQWALGKKLGDTIDYTDEYGRTFRLRLVGAVANSILQGSLLIDETEFTRRFPGESGYRMFLIDAPSNSVTEVSATLSRALQDVGLELTPAARRLNEFNAVQNTYLSTFQVLGGLGLLLGSAGLGVVVLRNVLERRGELAMLMAVGFMRRRLQRLVLGEHGALLALGLGLGILAAAIAVLPAILSPSMHLPYGSLALTLAAVFLNGLVWTWVATRYALRGNLLAALRNE